MWPSYLASWTRVGYLEEKMTIKFLLLVISIAISLRCGTAADEKGKPLITKTCAGTEFPDICAFTLESDPRSSSADLKSLSRIALELGATKANDVAGVAYQLMQNASGYETWSERSSCFHGYNMSTHQIKGEGLQSFDGGRYDKAYETVDLLNKEAVHCSSFNIPELAENNTLLSKFSTDVKTILHLLF